MSQKIFHKGFVTIHEIKPVLTIDKPIDVGFSIPDLSKYLIYKFHSINTLKENLVLIFYLQTQAQSCLRN